MPEHGRISQRGKCRPLNTAIFLEATENLLTPGPLYRDLLQNQLSSTKSSYGSVNKNKNASEYEEDRSQ